MQLPFVPCLVSLLFAQLAVGSVQFIAPEPQALLQPGPNIEVEWRYTDNSTVQISGSEYNLYLCAGGNAEGSHERVSILTTSNIILANPVWDTVQINPEVGEDYPNAYFFELVIDSASGSITAYSSRFTLSKMTGSFSEIVRNGIQTVTGPDGPAHRHILQERKLGAGGPHDVPFGQQTGPTRYAPVPKHPPTKITLKSAKPLFPTSSYKLATTFLPTPTIVTTISLVDTPTVAAIENTAAPASQPDDDMAKFLKRWQD
ncbi:hypothetical protein FQN57_002771 [Myotisia sp. PD_48]|nr:hypothetical protein FQN57_002771 [Myotisia sp. PD_48]